MIEAKLSEVRNALRAFTGTPGVPASGIGNAKVPAKAAYRIGRLVAKLTAESTVAEEAQRKVFRDAGAELVDGQLVLALAPQAEGESDADFEARAAAHRERVRAVNEQIEGLMSDTVKIDYDPIPIDLFGEAALMPADCALADKFLKE